MLLVDDLVSLLLAWTQLSYLPMIIASHSLPPRSFLPSKVLGTTLAIKFNARI